MSLRAFVGGALASVGLGGAAEAAVSNAPGCIGAPAVPGLVLETFEDGTLNIPGATASGGGAVLAPADQTDSVEGTPIVINGNSTTSGYSYYWTTNSVEFTFDVGQIGGLPKYAGIVWTDVGFSSDPKGNGFGKVTFAAFDGSGASLGSLTSDVLGNGAFDGAASEDALFFANFAGGIGRIRIGMPDSTDWEVDHLQYSLSEVPLPAALPLLATALAGPGSRRPTAGQGSGVSPTARASSARSRCRSMAAALICHSSWLVGTRGRTAARCRRRLTSAPGRQPVSATPTTYAGTIIAAAGHSARLCRRTECSQSTIFGSDRGTAEDDGRQRGNDRWSKLSP
jgi:hypothetical protein